MTIQFDTTFTPEETTAMLEGFRPSMKVKFVAGGTYFIKIGSKTYSKACSPWDLVNDLYFLEENGFDVAQARTDIENY